MKKLFLIFVALLLLASCTPEPTTITETVEVPVTVEVVNEVEVTRIVPEEVTRIVEQLVTATPTPQPAEFLTLEGSGDVVSDNFDWQPCDKAVFNYDATGERNFIVYLWKVGADDNRLLVNEIAPAAGEALQPILGGAYWLEVEANGSWSITAVCED